ncbi:MAG: hypothetical protein HY690_04340 [Chloroflexi bacterium]|nr:hypothetical protein [Chloroflexota bacterium]
MTLRLWVKLDTATLPGGGEGRAGSIDRDVVADALGLPRLPARRLKGLLLEAAQEVDEHLERDYGWPEARRREWVAIEAVFGRPGRRADEVGLQVGDLVLVDEATLREWLPWARHRWARHRHPGSFSREAVLRTYTEERSQTAIDSQTGAPQQNTLRRSRLLRRNLTFVGSVALPRAPRAQSLAEAVAEPHHRTLALACAGVQRLGQSRNRGLGHVATWLELGLPDGAGGELRWSNLTGEVVQALAAEPGLVRTP